MMFKQLAIIGIGLIGGSIARAARQRGLARRIVAVGRNEDMANLQLARRLNVVDAYHYDIKDAVVPADCIVIATPVASVESVFRMLRPYWKADAIYSDVCSTKVSVIHAAETVFGQTPGNFVPAHPIAGAECSGVAAGTADLFNNRRLIITPVSTTDPQAQAELTHFWEALGSKVSTMEAVHHDKVLAATSHFPHILAFALVNLLGSQDENAEIFKYSAGGFRDFSRIASSDPAMWRDICMANKQEIMHLIVRFQAELSEIGEMLEKNQSQRVFDAFTFANQVRQRFLEQTEQ